MPFACFLLFLVPVRQKINILGIGRDKSQSQYFTMGNTKPEYETGEGLEGATHPGCMGGPTPLLGGAATPSTPSASLCAYKLHLDLKTGGGVDSFQKEFHSAATTRNQDSDPKTPFWDPAGTGNLERIIAIVITNRCFPHP